MSYSIAVANQKGGVAKTTTTFSLGGVFAKQGYTVLLVDLDSQANLSQACGVNIRQVSGSILDVFYQWASLTAVSRETGIRGLDIVPSHPGMELAERFLPIRKNYQNILQTISQRWLGYDFVIFDCPPSLGAVTLNALNASDLLLAPVSPEVFSVEAIKNVQALSAQVQATSNPKLLLRFLVTMLDNRLRIHRDIVEQLNTHYADCLFSTRIQVDTRLRESFAANLPVNYYAPHSRSTLQYQALAEEIYQDAREVLSKPAE